MPFEKKPREFCTPAAVATRQEPPSQQAPQVAGQLPCWRDRCETPSVGFYGVKPFCAEHFIDVCYQRLDSIVSDLGYLPIDPEKCEEFRCELGQIADQVYVLSLWADSLTRFEQLRLLEIMEIAGTSLSRLPRGCLSVFGVVPAPHVDSAEVSSRKDIASQVHRDEMAAGRLNFAHRNQ